MPVFSDRLDAQSLCATLASKARSVRDRRPTVNATPWDRMTPGTSLPGPSPTLPKRCGDRLQSSNGPVCLESLPYPRFSRSVATHQGHPVYLLGIMSRVAFGRGDIPFPESRVSRHDPADSRASVGNTPRCGRPSAPGRITPTRGDARERLPRRDEDGGRGLTPERTWSGIDE